MVLHSLGSFKSAGLRQGWWSSRRMAVALSGGSDSMALLWLMVHRWEGEVVALHVDHGIRGQSSSSDAQFVSDHCRSIGVPCHIAKRDVPGEMLKGESVELAARRIRHRSLTDLSMELGCGGVVLGHNSDDVVETFLLNLARGTGPFGLAGIPEVNGCLFRPVMGISREGLRDILRDQGWSWVDDETNDQDIYLRNRIRNELLPLIEHRINSGVRGHILGLVRDMADFRSQEEEEGEAMASGIGEDLPLCLHSLSREGFRDLSQRERTWVLRHVGRSLDLRTLSRDRTERLLDLESRSSRWRFQWSSDVELCGDRNFLSWINRPFLEALPPDPVDLSGEGEGEFQGLYFSWSRSHKGEPFMSGLSVAVPLRPGDKVAIKPMASLSQRDRSPCPWWLLPHVPVVTINDLPIWSPYPGLWNSRWDFSSDSVKYESLCLVRFSDPDGR